MFYDDLPIWGFVGKMEKISKPHGTEYRYFLFTHGENRAVPPTQPPKSAAQPKCCVALRLYYPLCCHASDAWEGSIDEDRQCSVEVAWSCTLQQV